MTAPELAVRVTNELKAILPAVRQSEVSDALKAICALCHDVYVGQNPQPIIAPGGYKIPPLERTDQPVVRQAPPCCDG